MSRKSQLQELHNKSARPFLEANLCTIVYFGLMPVSLWAWTSGLWPITLLCWAIQAHFGHSLLLAFHEASHYVMHPNRRMNESLGIVIGTLAMTPLSAYRWVHNEHHVHLGTERDSELWPFVRTNVSRWQRLTFAFLGLILGFFYTPIIFLRGVLVAEGMSRRVRRRLVAEYALSALFWIVVLANVIYWNVFIEFLVVYLIPGMLAGNLQTLRQFTEHLGLFGQGVAGTTRTVVDQSIFGQLLSTSILHIDLHGPHHLHAKIPHFNLEAATPIVYEHELQEPKLNNIHTSYVQAIGVMLRTLPNPRIGPQWHQEPSTN